MWDVTSEYDVQSFLKGAPFMLMKTENTAFLGKGGRKEIHAADKMMYKVHLLAMGYDEALRIYRQSKLVDLASGCRWLF